MHDACSEARDLFRAGCLRATVRQLERRAKFPRFRPRLPCHAGNTVRQLLQVSYIRVSRPMRFKLNETIVWSGFRMWRRKGEPRGTVGHMYEIAAFLLMPRRRNKIANKLEKPESDTLQTVWRIYCMCPRSPIVDEALSGMAVYGPFGVIPETSRSRMSKHGSYYWCMLEVGSGKMAATEEIRKGIFYRLLALDHNARLRLLVVPARHLVVALESFNSKHVKRKNKRTESYLLSKRDRKQCIEHVSHLLKTD